MSSFAEPPISPAPEKPVFHDCFQCLLHSDWSYGPHSHPTHELVLLRTGQLESTTRGGLRVMHSGQVIFNPAAEKHYPRNVSAAKAETLCLHWTGGEKIIGSEGTLVEDMNGHLSYLMHWLWSMADEEDNQPSDSLLISNLLSAALREFVRLRDQPKYDLASRVARYLRENIRYPVSLDDLANHTGMSKFHFARTFRAQTGTTPMEFIRKQRLEAASALLAQTNLTLEAIAENVGFTDASHLSQVFRRRFGCAPGKLRKREQTSLLPQVKAKL